VHAEPHDQTSARLRAALAGEEASLGWLVARLSPLLVAQARWRLGPLLGRAYDPEDLVQDVWLVALPRLPSLAPRDGRLTPVLLRFLATTILQRINNLVRQELRRPGELCATATAGSEVAASVTGIVSAAIRGERRQIVLAAIDALDAVDREVLLLRGVEQRSGRTTAELLGISVDAVTMRYRRARDRLCAQLPDALFDELE